MPKLNQRGAIQLVILLILIIGVVAGVYLVQHPQIFRPKAGGGVSGPIVPGTGFTVEAGFDAYVGQEVAVTVTAKSDFDSANLFVAKLKFDKNLIRISRIDTDSTFIKNWVEQSYDNNTGDISLIGGVPTPGVQTAVGNAGHVATIYFVPLAPGSLLLQFTTESAVYRNSDNSNIIGLKQGATIPIYSGSATPTPASTPNSTVIPSPTPTASPMPIVTPIPGTGDGNNDGIINLVDLSVLLSDFNKTGSIRPGVDLNGDGKINTFDFALMRSLLITKGIIKP